MYRDSDTVFRLSLTGIAFIIIFILLIVFGGMYTEADLKRKEADDRLAQREEREALPHALEAFETARRELHAQLTEAGVNADDVIRRLLDNARTSAQAAALKTRVEDLNARLAALTEIKEILDQARQSAALTRTTEEAVIEALELRALLAQKIGGDIAAESGRSAPNKLSTNEISARTMAALGAWQQIQKAIGKELNQTFGSNEEEVTRWVQWLIDGHTQKSASARGNANLRSQIAFLRARLANHGDNTPPPCWFDEDTGKVQFLLTLELRPGNILVTPAWPSNREAEARAVPGIEQILAGGPLPHDLFFKRARPLSQHNGNQCQYAVQVRDVMRNGLLSERIFQQLETLFHTNASH
ncbi:MAG: hypothetical protein LBF50_07880 [Azoarcus sp.]|jgi:hypothetical protein|nr:hypothetical protein [Azoarcus sp.]